MTFVDETAKAVRGPGGRQLGQPRIGTVTKVDDSDGLRVTIDGTPMLCSTSAVALGDTAVYLPGNPSVCIGALAGSAGSGGNSSASLPAVLTSDYSGDIQAAIDATPDGGELWFDADITSDATAWTLGSGKSITIRRKNGAIITQGADEEVFQFNDSTSDLVALSSLTTANVAMTSGDGTTKEVAQFTVASVPSWLVAGARIKVAADDTIPGTHVSGGNPMRLGQFVTVHDVTGTTVQLTEVPYQWSSYGTTPRISEAPTASVKMYGLEIHGGAAGVAGEWSSKLVEFIYYRDVVIEDVLVKDSNSKAVVLQGCDGVQVDRYVCDGAENDPTNGQYGYGISLNSCQHYSLKGCTFIACRHGFTTDGTYLGSQQSNLSRYGRTMFGVVDDCHSRDSSNAGFDSHTDAYRLTYIGCTSIGNWRGENGVGAGFQMRGHEVRAIGCYSEGNAGYVFSNQATADAGKNQALIDCEAVAEDQAIWVLANGEALTGSRVQGGLYRSTNSSAVVQVGSTTGDDIHMAMRNVEVINSGNDASSADAVWLVGAGTSLEAIDCRFDIRDVSGSPRVVDCRDTDHVVMLIRPTIRCESFHTLLTADDSSSVAHIIDAVYEDAETPSAYFDADLISGGSTQTAAYP